MTELVFIMEEDPEGGLNAWAAGQAIFSQADSLDELRKNIREAVECHFGGGDEQVPEVRIEFAALES